MKIGNKTFDTKNNTYVMGILNVTPDSFSDGGRWNHIDEALKHTERMISEGASIIDIGGESTRPGYIQISEEEEIDRVIPVVEAIAKNFDITISVDTYKSKVAAAAACAGTHMINDIWACKYDPDMASIIAKNNLSVCLMHNRTKAHYDNFLKDLISDLNKSIDLTLSAGIDKDKIMVDPGVGFAKSLEENLSIMKRLSYLVEAFDYPFLLGTSRKSLIGKTLELPADERLEGTLVTTVMAVEASAAFVRVHDVKENVRTIKMTRAILEA